MITTPTRYGNIQYIHGFDSNDINIVGAIRNPGKEYQEYYFVGDLVNVKGDSHYGYIRPSIGMIIGVQKDDAGQFFLIETIIGRVVICGFNQIEKTDYRLTPGQRAKFEQARIFQDYLKRSSEKNKGSPPTSSRG